MRHLISGTKSITALPSDDQLLTQLAEFRHDNARVPINQQELAYTLCTFSYVVLRSLAIFQCEVTKDQQDAYVHSWAVAGHLIGVQDDMIPMNFEEAESLFAHLKADQFRATKEGCALASSLRTFMAEVLGLPWVGRQSATLLMRTLLDERTSEGLGIGRLSVLDRIVAVLLSVDSQERWAIAKRCRAHGSTSIVAMGRGTYS